MIPQSYLEREERLKVVREQERLGIRPPHRRIADILRPIVYLTIGLVGLFFSSIVLGAFLWLQ